MRCCLSIRLAVHNTRNTDGFLFKTVLIRRAVNVSVKFIYIAHVKQLQLTKVLHKEARK